MFGSIKFDFKILLLKLRKKRDHFTATPENNELRYIRRQGVDHRNNEVSQGGGGGWKEAAEFIQRANEAQILIFPMYMDEFRLGHGAQSTDRGRGK